VASARQVVFHLRHWLRRRKEKWLKISLWGKKKGQEKKLKAKYFLSYSARDSWKKKRGDLSVSGGKKLG